MVAILFWFLNFYLTILYSNIFFYETRFYSNDHILILLVFPNNYHAGFTYDLVFFVNLVQYSFVGPVL